MRSTLKRGVIYVTSAWGSVSECRSSSSSSTEAWQVVYTLRPTHTYTHTLCARAQAGQAAVKENTSNATLGTNSTTNAQHYAHICANLGYSRAGFGSAFRSICTHPPRRYHFAPAQLGHGGWVAMGWALCTQSSEQRCIINTYLLCSQVLRIFSGVQLYFRELTRTRRKWKR